MISMIRVIGTRINLRNGKTNVATSQSLCICGSQTDRRVVDIGGISHWGQAVSEDPNVQLKRKTNVDTLTGAQDVWLSLS